MHKFKTKFSSQPDAVFDTNLETASDLYDAGYEKGKSEGGEVSPGDIEKAVNDYFEENPLQEKLTDEQIDNINDIPNIKKSVEDAQITVDDVLSNTSINPVQNKVINQRLSDMNNLLGGGINVATNKANEAKTKADEALEQISNHNTSDESHNDIRISITELSKRLNAIADSDDLSLDQLSEIVAYIKSNKNLIDNITTSKVNVVDIIDNLTTNVSNKPLSAKQGVELKKLINAIVVPTLLSQLGDDAAHRLVTDTEKQTWNSKSNFGGKFSDLTNKPTTLDGYGITDGATKSEIPTKTSQLNNDSGFLTLADLPIYNGEVVSV